MIEISVRKADHIDLALRNDFQGPLTTWLEHVRFLHVALPETSIDDVSIDIEFLGYRLKAPLIICGMTGGLTKALDINRKLAEIAEEYRLAIGVGSQRAMLLNRDTISTYRIVREVARNVPVIANIGGAQLTRLRKEELETIIESIEANALAIHLNPAQELAQLEGDRDFKGIVSSIKKVLEWIQIPIIIKEVGMGLSKEVVKILYDIGVKFFDVAGAGGTNWVAIEIARLLSIKRYDLAETAKVFIEWGIPTAASIIETRDAAPQAYVIGSGGIRSGLDVAKAIALGADIAGMAQPFLKAVFSGQEKEFITKVINQLKIAMVLTGSKSIEELKNAPIVILNELAQWICARKLKLRNKRAFTTCSY